MKKEEGMNGQGTGALSDRQRLQKSTRSVLRGVAPIVRSAFATVRGVTAGQWSPMRNYLCRCSLTRPFTPARPGPPFTASLRRVFVSSLTPLCLVVLFLASPLFTGHWSLLYCQTEIATISGLITDETGGAVPGADVQLLSVARGTTENAKTNGVGIYVFNAVQPGLYQLKVVKAGFKQVDLLSLIVNVQDHIEQNVRLQVGSVSESVTVDANDLHINTTDASVSTVVDRQFAENLPLNGRSFQTLIQLTPGVVLVSSNGSDAGQFSVNGQRAASNYWMVDGVSANIGAGVDTNTGNIGNGLSGALGSFSVLGGTNSLVSVDALQEFRIQTSTYAPEFGRTPGGQISIVTRSGTNQFHGTAFDYFRNDILDANDWFANANKLPKPKERQNDFGGTFSGPILKDRTFFFFSYEGLRLRLPEVVESTVPDVIARQQATPALQPYLNAYPLPSPNTPDDVANQIGQFNASFSNAATLDAYSLRVDHKLNAKLNLFGRYNYSPSEIVQRGASQFLSLSTVLPSKITVQTGTLGTTWSITPLMVNDLRFNYSRTDTSSKYFLDSFGGAVPLSSLPFPSPFTSQNGVLELGILSLANDFIRQGANGHYTQRQINIVDSLSVQKGTHSLKLGVDFRRLSPIYDAVQYNQTPLFLNVASAGSGNPLLYVVVSARNATFLFRNLGLFAQDTWRIAPRWSLTYGLRWDVDFAPTTTSGPSIGAVTGFNLGDLSNLALAPAGTPPYHTKYGNFAPRVGIAYQISKSQDWQTVVRGGFGVFYDLASSEVGSNIAGTYPFVGESFNCCFTATFPLTPAAAAPPAITPAGLSSPGSLLFAFDPHLQLPYALQWNVDLEQALGRQQTITASYIGSVGRRLLQSTFVGSPSPSIANANLTGNTGISDYNALQVQFQRRLSHGLQILSSYTWSHSIDTGSAGSVFGNSANALVPGTNTNANRGPSDFDIRNAFSAGVTYDLHTPKINTFMNAILRGWSLQNVVQVRSAPPVNVYDGTFSQINKGTTQVRPDLVPGIPLYLYGPQYPGGKILNNTPNAGGAGCVGPFCPPPTDAKGNTLRQGDLGRNALRGFGATQWDFSIHRDFPIRESVKLQFRAEMFNVLNHPNFGQPVGDVSNTTQFGHSTQMFGRSLDQNVGGGSFSALYQIGGPRSIQLALKLQF